jgi:AcrR family transcriptional regulator
MEESLKRRRVDTEHNRAVILDSAMKVFGEKGYAGASIGEIAQEAGFSPAGLYVYFPNKEELFFSAIEEQFAVLGKRMSQALEGASDVDAFLEAYVREYLSFHGEHRDFLRVMVVEFSRHHVEMTGEAGDRHQRLNEKLKSTAKDALERCCPTDCDVEEILSFVCGMSLQAVLSRMENPVMLTKPIETERLLLFLREGVHALLGSGREHD